MCQTTHVPYRFIGINARELAYLGDQNPALAKFEIYRVDLTGAHPGILQRQLEAASRMGVKVVRIFAPRSYDANTDIRTLSDILHAINTHLDVKAAFPDVSAGLRELARCAAVGLNLFDERRECFVPVPSSKKVFVPSHTMIP